MDSDLTSQPQKGTIHDLPPLLREVSAKPAEHPKAKKNKKLTRLFKKLWPGKLFKSKVFRLYVFLILTVILAATLYAKKFQIVWIIEFFQNLDFDIYLVFVFAVIVLGLLVLLIYFLKRIFKIKRKPFNIFKAKRIGVVWVIILITVISILFFAYYKKHPKFSYTIPNNGGTILNYNSPVEVKINVPVRVEKLKASIVPELKGSWEWDSYLGISSLTRHGKFYIQETPLPDSRFITYIAGINKITDAVEHEYGFEMFATPIPKIESSDPLEGQDNFSRENSLIVNFDQEYQELVDLEASLAPQTEIILENTGTKTIKITPVNMLKQATEYKLTLTLKPKTINISTREVTSYAKDFVVYEINFKTPKEPLVQSFYPTGESVKVDEKIKVQFEEPPNKAMLLDHLIFDPAIDGEVEWVDDRTFVFNNTQLFDKEKVYKLTISSGLKSSKGGVLEKDLSYQFKTIGRVWILLAAPGDKSTYVDETTEVYFDFNQEVDKADAQSRFSIAPAATGQFKWDGNRMIFKPDASLALGTTYTVTVAAGIKSIYGLDSDTPIVISFTIRPNSYAFEVPLFFQQTSFSCNIYTAIMVLAWKGIGADAYSLISEIGYNDQRIGDTWIGNPYREYVGTADGDWGYGVYWPPIRNILSARGVYSEPREGWNVVDMANTIVQGHPVIVWRYNGVGGGQNISWTAWDGTYVYAFNGMHGTVVTGVHGNPNNPDAFYIQDPWLGRFWMDRWTFDAFWSYSGRMALVVY